MQTFGSLIRNDRFHRGEVTESSKEYVSTSEAMEDFRNGNAQHLKH